MTFKGLPDETGSLKASGAAVLYMSYSQHLDSRTLFRANIGLSTGMILRPLLNSSNIAHMAGVHIVVG